MTKRGLGCTERWLTIIKDKTHRQNIAETEHKKTQTQIQTTNKVSKPNDKAGSAGLYSSKSPGAVVDDNALSHEGGHHLLCLGYIYGVNEHKYK